MKVLVIFLLTTGFIYGQVGSDQGTVYRPGQIKPLPENRGVKFLEEYALKKHREKNSNNGQNLISDKSIIGVMDLAAVAELETLELIDHYLRNRLDFEYFKNDLRGEDGFRIEAYLYSLGTNTLTVELVRKIDGKEVYKGTNVNYKIYDAESYKHFIISLDYFGFYDYSKKRESISKTKMYVNDDFICVCYVTDKGDHYLVQVNK